VKRRLFSQANDRVTVLLTKQFQNNFKTCFDNFSQESTENVFYGLVENEAGHRISLTRMDSELLSLASLPSFTFAGMIFFFFF